MGCYMKSNVRRHYSSLPAPSLWFHTRVAFVVRFAPASQLAGWFVETVGTSVDCIVVSAALRAYMNYLSTQTF